MVWKQGRKKNKNNNKRNNKKGQIEGKKKGGGIKSTHDNKKDTTLMKYTEKKC